MRQLIFTIQVPDIFTGKSVLHNVYWDEVLADIVVTIIGEFGEENVVGGGNQLAEEPSPYLYQVSESDGDTVKFSQSRHFPYAEFLGYISPTPTLKLIITGTTQSGYNLNNGSVTASATGGVAPYEYSLDGLEYGNVGAYGDLAPGSYLMYVRDYTGQVVFQNFIITEALPPDTYSSTKSYTATCGINYSGSYTSTKTVTSNISQLDADSKALSLATIDANNNLVCTVNLVFQDIDDATEESAFTISYTPELKSWSSWHNHIPHYMFSKGDRLFKAKGIELHEFNKDSDTKFGEPFDVKLCMVFNDNPILTKVQDSLFLQSNDIFDTIQVSNSKQESPVKNIVLEDDNDIDVICKYRNSQYQLPLPRATDEARMRDKYVMIDFNKYNVSTQLQVKYVTLMYRANAR